ncbi:MAG: hypothetical protein ACYDA0_14805, partial [Candidatus Dormibacteraceae bacterium]
MSSRGPLDAPGRDRKQYTSPEYRELVAGSLDALVHPYPMRPPRLYPKPSNADSSQRGRRFRVIHPFHPLAGREYELVGYAHTWGEH